MIRHTYSTRHKLHSKSSYDWMDLKQLVLPSPYLSYPQCNPHAAYALAKHSKYILQQSMYSIQCTQQHNMVEGYFTILVAIKLDWTSAGPSAGPGTIDIHVRAVSKVQVQRAIQDHIIHIWGIQGPCKGHIGKVSVNISRQQKSIPLCIRLWHSLIYFAAVESGQDNKYTITTSLHVTCTQHLS